MTLNTFESELIDRLKKAESDRQQMVKDACSILCEIVRQINQTDNAADGHLTRDYHAIDLIRTQARDFIRTYGGHCPY